MPGWSPDLGPKAVVIHHLKRNPSPQEKSINSAPPRPARGPNTAPISHRRFGRPAPHSCLTCGRVGGGAHSKWTFPTPYAAPPLQACVVGDDFPTTPPAPPRSRSGQARCTQEWQPVTPKPHRWRARRNLAVTASSCGRTVHSHAPRDTTFGHKKGADRKPDPPSLSETT